MIISNFVNEIGNKIKIMILQLIIKQKKKLHLMME